MYTLLNFFFSGIAGLLLLCSCAKNLKTVRMDANATWASNSPEVLLLEFRYKTGTPQQPFFNSPDSVDWQIVAYRTERTLRQRREITRWTNASKDGGGLMHQPLHWLRDRQRLIFVESQSPTLLDLKSGRSTALRPPDAIISTIVGESLVANTFGRSPVPSPDGSTVGVYYTATYLSEGPLGPHRFIHFMSFFDSGSGEHLRSVRVRFSDNSLDPYLLPNVPGMPHFWRFLWHKDSGRVYVMHSTEAFLVSAKDGSVTPTKMVPARPVPGPSGPISSAGIYLYTQEFERRPNASKVSERLVPGWVNFESVSLLPLQQVRYAKP